MKYLKRIYENSQTFNFNELLEKFEFVRSVMRDFEDSNIIKYTFSATHKYNDIQYQNIMQKHFTKGDDINEYITYIIECLIERPKVLELYILSQISLPTEHGGIIRDNDKLLSTMEDIHTSIKRLEDIGLNSYIHIVTPNQMPVIRILSEIHDF